MRSAGKPKNTPRTAAATPPARKADFQRQMVGVIETQTGPSADAEQRILAQ